MFCESSQESTPLTSNKLSCPTDCWKVFSDLWVFLVPPRGKLSSMAAMFECPKNNGKVGNMYFSVKAVIDGQETEPSSTSVLDSIQD